MPGQTDMKGTRDRDVRDESLEKQVAQEGKTKQTHNQIDTNALIGTYTHIQNEEGEEKREPLEWSSPSSKHTKTTCCSLEASEDTHIYTDIYTHTHTHTRRTNKGREVEETKRKSH